jgi:hypothetical protein
MQCTAAMQVLPSEAAAAAAAGSSNSGSAATAIAGSSRLQLLERLDFHVLEFDRAQEEVTQVVAEMKDSLQWYTQRADAIISRRMQLMPSSSVPGGPDDLAAASQQGIEGSEGDCRPLQSCSFEQGAAWYLGQQLLHVQQLSKQAATLFQPVLHVEDVQVTTAVTVAQLEEAEGQLQEAVEQVVQQQQQHLVPADGEDAGGIGDGTCTNEEEALASGVDPTLYM